MDPKAGTQPATQEATQQYTDPRRLGNTLSSLSDEDLADVVCVLHANSQMALEPIRATMLNSPEHILQNDDLEGLTEADLVMYPEMATRTRDIALRMSAVVKSPRDGFRFGRNPEACDIVLTTDSHNRLISNVHFRIYVNDQGSLMVEDLSTNGTMLDDEMIKRKDRFGRVISKSNKRVIRHGSMLSFFLNSQRDHVKFMVRVPSRSNHEQQYERNLRHYLRMRGLAPKFASIRESSFGNYWNGGDKYNFTGILGRGAFATVYRLQTKSDGTVVAGKEIDSRKFIKNGVLDIKFDNELRIMRDLKHPNIVKFLDCVIHDHFIYLFMEHIPYGELTAELLAKGHLEERDVQQVTKQTLRALDYMHCRGITHRDIKPDNILIASRSPLIVKLSDFGLSKSVVDQNTFLRTFCGTLLYCAPEVYPEYPDYLHPPFKRRRPGDPPPTRASPYDSSADMWSFGAVIFHLLAGRAPVTGRGDGNGAQMLDCIMTQEIDYGPLRKIGASEASIDFVYLLLNRQPNLRPSEQECFQHPWLRNVPEVLDYSGVEYQPPPRIRQLETVEEIDEDAHEEANQEVQQTANEEVLLMNLQKLAGNSELRLVNDDEDAATPSSSEERPLKKSKIYGTESRVPEAIEYPYLPPQSQPTFPDDIQSSTPKLFGEITASVLKSSGLFGMGNQVLAPVAPTAQSMCVPQISSQMEKVSMNDFAISASNQPQHVTHVSHVPQSSLSIPTFPSAQPHIQGSAPSLLGAEQQLRQMTMGVPEATNVATETSGNQPDVAPAPETFLSSPSSNAESVFTSPRSVRSESIRRINLELIGDENAFAAEQRLREAAREENARFKAQTFHVSNAYGVAPTAPAAARTFDIPATHSTKANVDPMVPGTKMSEPADILRAIDTNSSALQSTEFGRLIPLDGSFSKQVIRLTGRSTVWGRAPQCNCQFEDVKDVRVPKFGLKIVFWAAGIEDAERKGADWKLVPKIRTIIATSARKGIKINGVHLAQESADGGAALFGKIYTGDIITVVESDKPESSLKFRVEILFGDSARARPVSEEPFQVRNEITYHARMKEKSVDTLSRSNEENMPPVNAPIGVSVS